MSSAGAWMTWSTRSAVPREPWCAWRSLPEAAGPDGKHEVLTLVRNKVNVEEQAAKKSIIDVDNDGVTHASA